MLSGIGGSQAVSVRLSAIAIATAVAVLRMRIFLPDYSTTKARPKPIALLQLDETISLLLDLGY
jgi:hypothetical protein